MKKRFTHGIPAQVKTVFLNIGIFLLYVVLGKLGLSFASVNSSTTAVWAPTGIALASILLFGYRVLPAIFLGAFVVNFSITGEIATTFFISIGNVLEAIVGAFLVKTFADGIHAFDSLRGIVLFTLLAAFLSTVVSANIGVTTLILGRLATVNDFWKIWFTWWLGDMGGNIVVAPLLLVWAVHPRIRFTPRGILHGLIAFGGVFIMTMVVSRGVLPYPYLCIPVGVWVAFWFGRRGATIATLLVAVTAIVNTHSGFGPFVKDTLLGQPLVSIQLFLSVFSLTVLTFAVTLLEFRKSKKIVLSQEKRFQALIEKSFDAVVLIDMTSRILYASPSVTRLLHYTPEELIGKIGFDLVVADDRPRVIRELAGLVLRPGGTVTVEYRSIRKDKHIIWVEVTGTNLLADPAVNAVVVNFHDITDKKAAEIKMLQEKMTDEAMLGSIGDGVFAADNKGKVTMINQAGCDILGWEEKELLGKDITEAVPLEDELGKVLTPPERPITKVLTLGKPIVTSSTIYYMKKNGTKFPVHFTVTPIILDKKVVGAIEVFHDITREKEVDKAKTEFVSVASHQLRTPLATINWYLEELIKNAANLNEKQVSYLKEVYAASKRMVELINALLNTSRLELGAFAVEPSAVQIPALVKQTIEELSQKIKQKQVTISEEYADSLPPMNADPKLLTIIIQNLLGNAIKYTKPKDTILFKVKTEKNEFVMSVTEHGYGIPKNQQPKIFTKLFRADNARMIEPEGTGLGLYIVKSIVSTTGGKIWFTSEENKGTTFFVSFPLSGMQQKKGQKQLI